MDIEVSWGGPLGTRLGPRSKMLVVISHRVHVASPGAVVASSGVRSSRPRRGACACASTMAKSGVVQRLMLVVLGQQGSSA